MKKALITGVTGQDGSYLVELLLEKNYEVHGIVRRASTFNTWRINHLVKDAQHERTFFTHYGDLTDGTSIISLIKKIQPDEIYNLGAQSHVKVSFETPEYTANADALGVLRVLEAVRLLNMTDRVKLYHGSTSELYGAVAQHPQNEETPFSPRSPYAAAKLYGYWIIDNYREAYDIFACNGILFNHESPRRGQTFVTRKITMALSMIKLGLQKKLYLGNIDAFRDWGYAPEYVEAMWQILQLDKPDDFVIATGKSYTVRDFVEYASRLLDFDLVWEGEGQKEVGIDNNTGDIIVAIDPRYYRPTEVETLCGDSNKAKLAFGWNPKVGFGELVKIMIEADYNAIKNGDVVY